MEAKEVKEFFERVASDWDTMRLAYYDERVIEKLAEVSGIGESSEVADVGTGTDFVAAGLAPRVAQVVGRLWMLKRWALWLTIIACLLGGIFSWAPVILQAPTVLHQGLAAVVVARSVLIFVLVLLPTSRRAYF